VPIPTGIDVRILWSMDGNPKLRLTAVAADGSRVAPSSLAFSAGARWGEPGTTWSSTFTFPQAGCWRIVAQRGDRYGEVWLRVGQP
jgi:hypothetical protein